MKTIKTVADELNVTKQTVVNNAKSLGIVFEKKSGVNYINDDDCLKIINKIGKKEKVFTNKKSIKKNKYTNTTKEISDESQSLKIKVNDLEKQIEIYENKAKNDEKYIDSLNRQLNQQNSNVNTLNKLLENQQVLALNSNKKIQELENQLAEMRKLNYSYNKTEKRSGIIKENQQTYTNRKDDELNQQNKNIQENNTKKGFWSRLFRNN
ncbi:DUF536 domain-containing protein [Mammaliicoccus lentus]|uniref:DUF536 domain-containing protein n=1 Tax=Mammaliicoccus lentus TaxID=42858 RepID=UPI002B25F66D|nr:DUF536 domain-containing protein [Mammaliicoccus lentus]WQK51575.1 DUF536 domain-containing protein [Mammaliicoccus lentus]